MNPSAQLEEIHQRGVDLLEQVVEEPSLSLEMFQSVEGFIHQLVEYTAQQPEMALNWATNASVATDAYLADHSFNVCLMGVVFGIEMAYSDPSLLAFATAAFLHDIGMYDLPYHLIYRTADFSDEERAQMQQHPYLSVRRIQHLEALPEEVVFGIQDEHERCDGSGYAEQKTEEMIHPFAKALQVIDIYEALTHPRPYRDHWMSPQQAMCHLISMARQDLLDTKVVKHWLNRMAFYPIGSFVRLNNGSIGKVVSARRCNPLQPLIAVFRDTNEQPLNPPQIMDLTEKTHLHIVESISPDVIEGFEDVK